MTEPNWKPLFRTPESTITKVLRSPAFLRARERSVGIIESSLQLRSLADQVESLDHSVAPLSAVADRVGAAVRFCRSRADRLEGTAAPENAPASLSQPGVPAVYGADVAARQRLIVASLLYLVTSVDLVPDVRAGGYIDDVVLLAWVFGATAGELTPYLPDDQAGQREVLS